MEWLSDELYKRAKKEGFATSGSQLDEALQLLEQSISAENLPFERLPTSTTKLHESIALAGISKKRLTRYNSDCYQGDVSEFSTLWCEAQKGSAKTRLR